MAMPFYSVRSSSLAVREKGAASLMRKESNRSSRRLSDQFGPSLGSNLLSSVAPFQETIETLDSTCTNPKTAFVLGETVCARVTGVTENDRFVNWFGPSGHAFGSSTSTAIADDQAHDFTYTPTEEGTWKATIADGSDSSILPTVFSVEAQSGRLKTFVYPGCTVPKVSFDLGETVCAKITGAPQPEASRAQARLGWVSPYGSLTQGADIVSDPQAGSYVIPNAATQAFTDVGGGSVTVDNRGVWALGIYATSDGAQLETTNFSVHDPVKRYVDLSVHQAATLGESSVTSGSGSVFKIFISNRGPDAAQSVVITDTMPATLRLLRPLTPRVHLPAARPPAAFLPALRLQ